MRTSQIISHEIIHDQNIDILLKTSAYASLCIYIVNFINKYIEDQHTHFYVSVKLFYYDYAINH